MHNPHAAQMVLPGIEPPGKSLKRGLLRAVQAQAGDAAAPKRRRLAESIREAARRQLHFAQMALADVVDNAAERSRLRRQKSDMELAQARRLLASRTQHERKIAERTRQYEKQQAEARKRRAEAEARMVEAGLLPIWFYDKDGVILPQYREQAAKMARMRRIRMGLQCEN